MTIGLEPGLEPYDAPARLAPGLICVEGAWGGGALRRRMTLLELSAGWVVHSAIRVSDADRLALLGGKPVAALVAPNRFHGSELDAWAEQYPEARVFVPRDFRRQFRKLGSRVEPLEEAWPTQWRPELDVLPLAGVRHGESLLLHAATRTLVVTDLVFNVPAGRFTNPVERLLMGWNGVVGRFGPSRLFNGFFVRDRAAFARSLRAALARDFDRLVLSHGEIIERGARSRLAEAFADAFSALPT